MKKFVSVAVVACFGGVAFAQPPEGDVFVEVAGGEFRTGFISEDGSMIDRSLRVHYAPLGVDVPNEIDEPGFQGEVGGLGSLSQFSFSFTKALRQWNGTDFSTISPLTMSTVFGPASATTPLADVLTPGLTFANEPSGAHDHPTWVLNAPATDGIYLMEIVFSGAGVQDSTPVWMLFGQNATEMQVDAAYDWATANIPAPGAAALLGVGGLLAMRRRRTIA
jgi:MYXO-CTERM domain-containing protein